MYFEIKRSIIILITNWGIGLRKWVAMSIDNKYKYKYELDKHKTESESKK